ncbi:MULTISPECIES: NADPH:quinone oxidoreductase family protein [Rhodopseudomonas]|uniref:NADPH:quinone oxidoreductase n=1 Tax=Rhodopseudomonas palustris TaxID=1076 RepID=A0A0D7EJR1_RHOPL|nr:MULTISPECIES: NADPH:quinone oxidoreductase family protein [Rhodopseudomonas]KIZ40755.1 NADPH:quinone oxidoreductase [Rhodopseudomonas palustris]MDF3813740.1 NADPH:quinone oxidoreductase family protein [Rhodopseudomonas sp. BAL398]WOK17628.1 NADPH:quinone oxidoreductase family protein [Rhodopseudomonas sp. BAL398]
MKALLSREIGGPDSLTVETVDDPRAGPGEVVIDVEACGVNFPDALLIWDKYQIKAARPFSPGSEVCGFISSLGTGVQGFAVGQRVIARCAWGGMAERVRVTADRCLPVPDGLPAEELATLQFTYATTFHALQDRAALRKGETLLVLGAAGGVGTAAVELGKAFGARVIAACSSAEKQAFAASRGADVTVAYPRAMDREGAKAFSNSIKEAAGTQGVDVILDPVGGDYTEAALRSIGRNGRLLVVGFPAGIARIPMNLPLLKYCSIMGVDWRNFNINESARSAENSRTLIKMYQRGEIRPTISTIFPLGDAKTAIRQMADRAVLGKVAIRIASSPKASAPRRRP